MPKAVRPHGYWVGTHQHVRAVVQHEPREEGRGAEEVTCGSALEGPPGHRAEDGDWFAMVVKPLGEEQGLKIFREIARRTASRCARGTLLAASSLPVKCPSSLTYSHGAEKMNRKGAAGGGTPSSRHWTVPTAWPSAKTPPHPNAAQLFADFVLSPEARRSSRRRLFPRTSGR
jgi:iron(III) transport system substrate-binding protein